MEEKKINDIKTLAACALFKNLCEKELDVYDALAEFVRQQFVNNNGQTITLEKLSDGIYDQYHIALPASVVRHTLKKIPELEFSKGEIKLKEGSSLTTRDIRKDMYAEEHVLSNWLDELCLFIEQDQCTKLSTLEKETVAQCFCDYLLDDQHPSLYSTSIYKFILRHRLNGDFVKLCDRIKEGYIEYEGITNNDAIDISKVVTSKLVIYLETEILFNAAGYNGEVYKRLFDEFKYYVDKINKNSHEKGKGDIILLKYFEETKTEIDGYFASAEDVIRGKKGLLPNHKAMSYFREQCHSVDELIELQARFYKLLKDLGISQDTHAAFYSHNIQQNWQYAIDRTAFTENMKQGSPEYEKVNKNLDFLEFIKIRRGLRSNTPFNSIGHILLTSNHSVHELAWSPKLRREHEVPLATYITYLTNRFWLACGGILTQNELSSINIISRVQMVLSAKLQDTTARLFDELKEKVKSNTITTEVAAEITAQLRMKTIIPDDLTDVDDFDDWMKFINEPTIDSFVATGKSDKEELKRLRKQEQDRKERPVRICLTIGLFLLWLLLWCLLIYLVSSGLYAIYQSGAIEGNTEKSWCCIILSIEWWQYIKILSPCFLLFKKLRRFFSVNLFRKRNVDALIERIAKHKK